MNETPCCLKGGVLNQALNMSLQAEVTPPGYGTMWALTRWTTPSLRGLVHEIKRCRVSRRLNIDSWIVAESAVKSV